MEFEMSRDQEEMVSKEASSTHIAKGKRTKRLRLLSSSSPSGVAGGGMTSSCSSEYYNSSEEEEEDMANCLILLAQGGGGSSESSHHDDDGKRGMSNGSSTFASNLYIYECKTCNRTFPSFQALGGHRASHKKPKLLIPEQKKKPSPPPPKPKPVVTTPEQEFEEAREPRGHTISLQRGGSTNNKAKIHECSICGSEFSSGQALGGHMRRHRATANIAVAAATATSIVDDHRGDPPRNILELDLNLPAPEESMFQFPATQKSMVLSITPALVDCHY